MRGINADGANNQPKVIDLFAGVGGLSLGAARAGFEVRLAVDWDKHAVAAHRQNFPLSAHLQTDIFSLEPATLLAAAGIESTDIFGIVGGPPCQGFSSIGRRASGDARNNLFIRLFELISQCEPAFFVVENVLGILDDTHRKIRNEGRDLVRAKYTLLPVIKLKASDFGAATSRQRVFFIGYRSNLVEPFGSKDIRRKKVDCETTVARALDGLPALIRSDWQTDQQGLRPVSKKLRGNFGSRISGAIPIGVGDVFAIQLYRELNVVSGCMGTRHLVGVRRRFDRLGAGEKDATSKAVRLDPQGFCPTLRAGTGPDRGSYQAVRPVHPTSPRVITPREAARLQGFPDWFQFAPSKWHSFRQIGNSVSPFVAEAVLSVIRSQIRDQVVKAS